MALITTPDGRQSVNTDHVTRYTIRADRDGKFEVVAQLTGTGGTVTIAEGLTEAQAKTKVASPV